MKIRKKYHFWKSSLRGLHVLFRIQPIGMVLYILGSAVHGLSWALEILCMQYFFDTVSQSACGETEIVEVFVWLMITGISYAFSQFMNGAFNCYGQICNLKTTKNMNKMLFDRINAMKLEEYENVAQMECLNRAINGSQFLFWVCTTVLDLVFYYGIYFALVGGYMMHLEPILGCSIILIFVPCLLSKVTNYYIFGKKEEESASVRRHVEYYEKYMVGREYFKETRLLGVSSFFHERYEKALTRLGKIESQAQKTKSLAELAAGIVTVACYCSILYMLVVFVMDGKISAGAFVAVLGSLSRLYSNMDEIVSERIGWATENVVAVDNFLEFVEEPETEKRNIDIRNFQEILLQQVGYTYPGSATSAVRDINLSIKRGETLAIVGENGSGKSTLCRLIMGMYRDHVFIVLDEPTAALDPLEESRVYQQFGEMCRHKTAIVVTHRMASARVADRILVLKDGKIVQEGSFKELSKMEGEFQRMYEEQRKWYVESGFPIKRL